MPQYIPKLSNDAFEGFQLPPELKQYATFISLEGDASNLPTQTVANVVDNRVENGLVLSEFDDYNFSPKAKRFVVSRDEPIWPDNREKLVGIFDNHEGAEKCFLSDRQKAALAN